MSTTQSYQSDFERLYVISLEFLLLRHRRASPGETSLVVRSEERWLFLQAILALINSTFGFDMFHVPQT